MGDINPTETNLERAKRLYPEGTVFKSMWGSDEFISGDHCTIDELGDIFGSNLGMIYSSKQNKWADIVQDEITLEVDNTYESRGGKELVTIIEDRKGNFCMLGDNGFEYRRNGGYAAHNESPRDLVKLVTLKQIEPIPIREIADYHKAIKKRNELDAQIKEFKVWVDTEDKILDAFEPVVTDCKII